MIIDKSLEILIYIEENGNYDDKKITQMKMKALNIEIININSNLHSNFNVDKEYSNQNKNEVKIEKTAIDNSIC